MLGKIKIRLSKSENKLLWGKLKEGMTDSEDEDPKYVISIVEKGSRAPGGTLKTLALQEDLDMIPLKQYRKDPVAATEPDMDSTFSTSCLGCQKICATDRMTILL